MITDFSTRLIVLGVTLLVVFPALFAAAGYFWNNKYIPSQMLKGRQHRRFNQIIKAVNNYTFKEDTATLAKKAPKIVQKLLSVRAIHVFLWVSGVVGFTVTGNLLFLLTFPFSFFIGIGRALPVINKRDKALERIFAIASSSIRFQSKASKTTLPPSHWNHVQVQKWEGTEPVEMVMTFPSGNGPDRMSQRAFEKTFKENITNDHDWNYEWDLPGDKVTIKAVPNLPTMLEYPGTEGVPWNVFPVGEAKEGTAAYDVNVFPHVLVGGPSGTGKALDLRTPVFTFNKGWVTLADIQVGDLLAGTDGNPTKVTHLHPVITPAEAYKVTFKNGEAFITDPEHLWETETRSVRDNRLHAPNTEPFKQRRRRLNKPTVDAVTNLLSTITDDETISIPELAELLHLHPTSQWVHQLAKQVGPAEQINKKVLQHYNTRVVSSTQNVARVPLSIFVDFYNARNQKPTKRTPLLSSHYEKLHQLSTEIRDTDTLHSEDLLNYIDAWQKETVQWVKSSLNRKLPASQMVKELERKAATKHHRLPSMLLLTEEQQKGTVSRNEAAALLGVSVNEISSLWSTFIRNNSAVTIHREQVTQQISEKTVVKTSAPYFTYPKKLILTKALEQNNILWDQQDKLNGPPTVKTTREIQSTLSSPENISNHYVKKASPLVGVHTELPIHPYVLGAWLGDGYSRNGTICGIDEEIFSMITANGYQQTNRKPKKTDNPDFQEAYYPLLHKQLKQNGLLHNNALNRTRKHIPDVYFTASIEQRMELLRGMLDTDGSVDSTTGSVLYQTSSLTLLNDVEKLLASLGYVTTRQTKTPSYMDKGIRKHGKIAYTIAFQANPEDKVFHLTRQNLTHAEKTNPNNRLQKAAHLIKSVETTDPVPMRCVTVDAPDRLFLVGNTLIPTHNSVLQRNIVFHTIQHNDRWRFLGVDLKRVELTPYNKYKKTVLGIATEVDQGLEVLKYAYNEMMDRYKMMEQNGVQNLMELADPPHSLLIMIDEATIFLGSSGSKTEEGKAEDAMKAEASDLVGKLLRLGRAASVHMLIAMQRPDATVLRGEYKANMDVRLAAGRMDSTPSSMILDSGEAASLPGIKGRGLIRVGGGLTEFQGFFAPPSWIDSFILQHPEVEPSTVLPGGHLHDKYTQLHGDALPKQPEPAPTSTLPAEMFIKQENAETDEEPVKVPPSFFNKDSIPVPGLDENTEMMLEDEDFILDDFSENSSDSSEEIFGSEAKEMLDWENAPDVDVPAEPEPVIEWGSVNPFKPEPKPKPKPATPTPPPVVEPPSDETGSSSDGKPEEEPSPEQEPVNTSLPAFPSFPSERKPAQAEPSSGFPNQPARPVRPARPTPPSTGNPFFEADRDTL